MTDPEDAWLLWKPPKPPTVASFHDVFVAGFHAALAAQPDDADDVISAKWSSLRWRANEELAHSEPPDVARVARMAYETGARDGLAAATPPAEGLDVAELGLAIHKWTAGREWIHAKGGHHFSDHCICYRDAEAIAREYDGPIAPEQPE